jgi:uncharacterized protein (DUF4415 family)
MAKTEAFPFERARRVTPAETKMFRRAYFNTFGRWPPRRGRPPKGPKKYVSVQIRLHPEAVKWARTQARKRGIGYQTLINETLLTFARRALASA